MKARRRGQGGEEAGRWRMKHWLQKNENERILERNNRRMRHEPDGKEREEKDMNRKREHACTCECMCSVCICARSPVLQCVCAPDWVSLPLFAVRIKRTAPAHAHSRALSGARLWGTFTTGGVSKHCAHGHMAVEMMSTFNNSCWRLHGRIWSEDKDSLLHTEWDSLTAVIYCRHFKKAAMWLALVSCRQVLQLETFLILPLFPWGRAVFSCMRKLNPVWSRRSNTIIPIPWVWVAANLSWLWTGLSN